MTNYLQKLNSQNAMFFDTETGGLRKGQRMFSYAVMPYGSDKYSEYIRNVGTEELKGFSSFSRELYKSHVPNFSGDLSKSIAANVLKPMEQGAFTIGHNLNFDFSIASEEGIYAGYDMSRIKKNMGIHPDNPLTVQYPDNFHSQIRSGDYSLAYKRYKNYLNAAIESKIGGGIDTLQLTRMAMGYAEQKGIANFGGDYFTGTKMEVISRMLGEVQQTHHSGEDVEQVKGVFNWATSSLEELNERGSLTGQRLEAMQRIAAAQPKLAEYNLKSKLLEYANEFASTGQVVTKTTDRVPTQWATSVDEFFGQLPYYGDKGLYTKNYKYKPREVFDRYLNILQPLDETKRQSVFASLQAKQSAFEERVIAKGSRLVVPNGKQYTIPTRTKSFLKYGAMAFGAWALYNAIPGGDDAYNTIEGLRHGGIAQELRQENTDFGSGWQGLFPGIWRNFKTGVKTYKGTALAASLPGFIYGYHKGKESGKIKPGSFIAAMAIDMADDALIFGAAEFGKRVPLLEKIRPVLEHPITQRAGIGFFGFTAGKLIGEVFEKISGRDDVYNTIQGLHHGGLAQVLRKQNTDFGSGYQGPNPQLNAEYNEAEDVYRFEAFRASKIGLSEAELYKWMTQEDKETSEYVAASASAGTALHQWKQAERHGTIPNYKDEILTLNAQYGISGHIDEWTDKGIGDIKSVQNGIFDTIVKSGRPKPMHYDQVQFYLGNEGVESGYINYVSREQPNREKTFYFQANPYRYQQLLRKVERVQRKVKDEIAAGKLVKSNLPKTASVQRLIEDSRDKETPDEMIGNTEHYKNVFKQEMQYLQSIKRGMPQSGPGRTRIQQREREKREQAMVSTQGIGLQLFNTRKGSHYL